MGIFCISSIKFTPSESLLLNVAMAGHGLEGDDIDTEALQSQIDLSMSLVHNIVSSWMKPSQKVGTKSYDDAQQELEEYMQRPSRYARTCFAGCCHFICLSQARGWSTHSRGLCLAEYSAIKNPIDRR